MGNIVSDQGLHLAEPHVYEIHCTVQHIISTVMFVAEYRTLSIYVPRERGYMNKCHVTVSLDPRILEQNIPRINPNS